MDSNTLTFSFRDLFSPLNLSTCPFKRSSWSYFLRRHFKALFRFWSNLLSRFVRSPREIFFSILESLRVTDPFDSPISEELSDNESSPILKLSKSYSWSSSNSISYFSVSARSYNSMFCLFNKPI